MNDLFARAESVIRSGCVFAESGSSFSCVSTTTLSQTTIHIDVIAGGDGSECLLERWSLVYNKNSSRCNCLNQCAAENTSSVRRVATLLRSLKCLTHLLPTRQLLSLVPSHKMPTLHNLVYRVNVHQESRASLPNHTAPFVGPSKFFHLPELNLTKGIPPNNHCYSSDNGAIPSNYASMDAQVYIGVNFLSTTALRMILDIPLLGSVPESIKPKRLLNDGGHGQTAVGGFYDQPLQGEPSVEMISSVMLSCGPSISNNITTATSQSHRTGLFQSSTAEYIGHAKAKLADSHNSALCTEIQNSRSLLTTSRHSRIRASVSRNSDAGSLQSGSSTAEHSGVGYRKSVMCHSLSRSNSSSNRSRNNSLDVALAAMPSRLTPGAMTALAPALGPNNTPKRYIGIDAILLERGIALGGFQGFSIRLKSWSLPTKPILEESAVQTYSHLAYPKLAEGSISHTTLESMLTEMAVAQYE